MTATLAPPWTAVANRLDGAPLLAMLDVDGTLAPIAPRPEDAAVPPETRRAVAVLASRRDTHVALVSGRAAADARRVVGVSNVWVIGNHGAEVVSPDGEVSVDPRVAPYEQAMAQSARLIANHVSAVPGVIVENKVWTLSVHHRLADPAVVPRLRSVVEEVATPRGLRVTEGKMLLEVRPPAEVHKGTAVLALARRLGGLAERASLVFIGDDRTDEDAFAALRAHAARPVTVRVVEQDAETRAEFAVRGPEEVREFLEWLAEARS